MKRPSPVVPSASPKRAARWLPWVLVAYVLLASVYSVSTPILEAPDEMFHFPLVDHIADEHLLSDQDRFVKLFGGDRTSFVLDIKRSRRVPKKLNLHGRLRSPSPWFHSRHESLALELLADRRRGLPDP